MNYVGASFFPAVCQKLTFQGPEGADAHPISTEHYEQGCPLRQMLRFSLSLWSAGLRPKAIPLPSAASWLRARLSDLEDVMVITLG